MFFIWEFKIFISLLVLNQYSKQLMIFVESKKKFLIWEFSSDLYHIYTIDFICFDVRNGQWFYNSMRPKRCLVDLDVVWGSWRSSFGICVMQRNALNSKMIFRSLNLIHKYWDSCCLWKWCPHCSLWTSIRQLCLQLCHGGCFGYFYSRGQDADIL